MPADSCPPWSVLASPQLGGTFGCADHSGSALPHPPVLGDFEPLPCYPAGTPSPTWPYMAAFGCWVAGGGPGGPHAMVPPLSARLAGHWPAGLRVGAAQPWLDWAGQRPGYSGRSGHLQQGPPGSGRPGRGSFICLDPPSSHLPVPSPLGQGGSEATVLAWSLAGPEAGVGDGGRQWMVAGNGPESVPLSLGLGLCLVSSPSPSPSPAQPSLAPGSGSWGPPSKGRASVVLGGAGALSLKCAGTSPARAPGAWTSSGREPVRRVLAGSTPLAPWCHNVWNHISGVGSCF